MVDFREPGEGQEVRGVREGKGADMEGVHGDDPGLAASALSASMAESLVESTDTYLPIESLTQQAATLMVYGMRLGGPIGSLLRVAAHAIQAAIMHHDQEYGPYDLGGPEYHAIDPGFDA